MKAVWIAVGGFGGLWLAWTLLRLTVYLYEERCYRRHKLLRKKALQSMRTNP